MLPCLGLTSNHHHYRWQLKTRHLSLTLWGIQAYGLHFLLNDGIGNSSVTFLHDVDCHFYLHSSPSPINRTPQAKLNILCIAIGKPLLEQAPLKEQDCLISARTTALVI